MGAWLEARKAQKVIVSVAPVMQGGQQDDIIPFLANVAKEAKIRRHKLC